MPLSLTPAFGRGDARSRLSLTPPFRAVIFAGDRHQPFQRLIGLLTLPAQTVALYEFPKFIVERTQSVMVFVPGNVRSDPCDVRFRD